MWHFMCDTNYVLTLTAGGLILFAIGLLGVWLTRQDQVALRRYTVTRPILWTSRRSVPWLCLLLLLIPAKPAEASSWSWYRFQKYMSAPLKGENRRDTRKAFKACMKIEDKKERGKCAGDLWVEANEIAKKDFAKQPARKRVKQVRRKVAKKQRPKVQKAQLFYTFSENTTQNVQPVANQSSDMNLAMRNFLKFHPEQPEKVVKRKARKSKKQIASKQSGYKPEQLPWYLRKGNKRPDTNSKASKLPWWLQKKRVRTSRKSKSLSSARKKNLTRFRHMSVNLPEIIPVAIPRTSSASSLYSTKPGISQYKPSPPRRISRVSRRVLNLSSRVKPPRIVRRDEPRQKQPIPPYVPEHMYLDYNPGYKTLGRDWATCKVTNRHNDMPRPYDFDERIAECRTTKDNLEWSKCMAAKKSVPDYIIQKAHACKRVSVSLRRLQESMLRLCGRDKKSCNLVLPSIITLGAMKNKFASTLVGFPQKIDARVLDRTLSRNWHHLATSNPTSRQMLRELTKHSQALAYARKHPGSSH